ncbi:MAG: hypothetical protein KDK70_19105 [Myxococcales bacterium]|nr:hypothetical protein [Myxococcales bacterium]
MVTPFHRFLPPLVLLGVLGGCEDRVAQCNELIGRLNPHTEAMIAGVEGLARIESDPGRLDALVAAIDTAEAELSVLELQDPRLAGLALRYRKQLMDARAAVDAMRAATAKHDAAGLNAAAKQADAFLDAQASIVEELNAYCTGG